MNGYRTVWEVEKLLGNAANKSGRVVANAANRTLPTGAKVIKQETAKIRLIKNKVLSCLSFHIENQKSSYILNL